MSANKARLINDNDVIQSIYANKKEKFDVLGLEPSIKDREQELEYFNKLAKPDEVRNNKPISYYNTISTISKLGISNKVQFGKDELREMAESKYGGGVIPAVGEDSESAFVSRLPSHYDDESGSEVTSMYDLNGSFHSWLQNSKNKKLPDLLSHLLYKESNVNVETLMMMNEEELKNWSDNINLGATKNDTAELVDAFILYKKYVHLFK